MKFDWLGDWLAVGMEDQAVVTRVAAALEDHFPELPLTKEERRKRRKQDELVVAADLPLYAVIEIRSRVAAGLALTAVRSEVRESFPNIEWKKYGEHGGNAVVRVRYREDCREDSVGDCDVELFYALTRRAIVISLQEATLRRVIDELEARSPAAETDGPDGQFVAELEPQPDRGLWTVASWYLQKEAMRGETSSRALAEVLLRGAPGVAGRTEAFRRLALASFGAVPVTPDGALYRLTREGVLDPARGTRFAPIWPEIPVAGSPAEGLLRSVRGVRWTTAFDDEGKTAEGRPMRSLHVRATLSLTSGE